MALGETILETNGRMLARGAARLLASHGFQSLEEFVPASGLRVDLMALGPRSEIWIVECKSGVADFRADRKWQGYLDWCDRFFWAVDSDFPVDLLPDATGLILADDYGGEIVRVSEPRKLSPARRKSLVHGFALTAARRLHHLRDPAAATL
jgi:hypothetical protein